MFRLTLACNLFPDIITQSKKYSIPLFDYQKPWGMFDITKYYNDGTRKTLNCEPHFDPGLLSLHLRSTEPGLQLQDENGNWINPPNNPKVGIIWAGDVATKINPQIKHGVHRVQNLPDSIGKPRIAIWHEICTKAQEHTELIETKKESLSYDEGVTGIPTSKSLPIDKWDKPHTNSIHSKTKYRMPKSSSVPKFMIMQTANGSYEKIEFK